MNASIHINMTDNLIRFSSPILSCYFSTMFVPLSVIPSTLTFSERE